MRGIKYLWILAGLLCFECTYRQHATIDLDKQSDQAELFAPGIVSTGMYERDLAISPDRSEIVYTLGDHRQTRRCLVSIKKTGKKWGDKQILSFSGLYDDIEPFFSADGRKLYFSSNRPVNGDSLRKDYNIWFAEKTENGWQDPLPLPATINSTGDEFYPSVSENNNIFFTSVREYGIGSEDIFVSHYENGTYSDPSALDSSINSSTYEFNAYVSPDESIIVFTSYGRKDDMGGGDLYYSIKDSNGEWKPAINMGPGVNSVNLDFCPFFDISTQNLYFTSDRFPARSKIESVRQLEGLANQPLNGAGNIYRIHLQIANDR